MMSLRMQVCWTKMMSLRGTLTAQACHPTKFVNKAEEHTILSTNISYPLVMSFLHLNDVFFVSLQTLGTAHYAYCLVSIKTYIGQL
jgi:hypothetical protein